MSVNEDLLIFFLTLIVTIMGFFIKSLKSDYDEKLKAQDENIKQLDNKMSTITLTQNTQAMELKYILDAVSRIESGFRDQEHKREKFLDAIQAKIEALSQKIEDAKK